MLLHELNNHTQYLTALGALAREAGALDERAAGLAHTGREVRELGWILGLCAGGLGTDLVFERSERAGLAPLARLVRQTLRRAGHDLERADRELPELAPRLGWRGAWRFGALLHAAARAARGPLAWEVEAEDGVLVLDCRVAAGALDDELRGVASASARGPDWSRFVIRAEAAP